jgi:hypothetical protein
MIINLSPKEISTCKKAASMRWQLARVSNVANQKKDASRSDGQLDELGVMAELCVHKLFNIEFDYTLSGIDTGADLYIGDYSIDVKATFYPDGKLIFKSNDYFKADASVLVCQITEGEYRIAGCISRAGFNHKSVRGRLKPELPECNSVGQSELSDIKELWSLVMQKKLKFN